jgi:hypothetical protein
MHITAMCVIEAKAQADKIEAGETLYRGLNGVTGDISEMYPMGETIYWSSLSSCTTKLKVARGFALGAPNCVIFEIHLSKTNPHPHMKMPEGWSQHQKEAEVLLLSYFAFKVTSIRKGADQNPKENYDYIVIEQDEAQNILSFDESSIQKHWKNVFDNVEKSAMKCFTEMRYRIPATVKVTKYLSGQFIDEIKLTDLNGDVDDYLSLCIDNLLQRSKEQILKDPTLIEYEEMIQVLCEKIDFDIITTSSKLCNEFVSGLKEVLKRPFTNEDELKKELQARVQHFDLVEVEKEETVAFVNHLQLIEKFFLNIVKSELFSSQ